MKKCIAAALALALGLGSLAGCSSSVFEEEEDTSIECAIQVGSQAIKEEDFKQAMINYKKVMLQQNGAQDTAAYWDAASDDVPGISRSDFLLEQVSEQLILTRMPASVSMRMARSTRENTPSAPHRRR